MSKKQVLPTVALAVALMTVHSALSAPQDPSVGSQGDRAFIVRTAHPERRNIARTISRTGSLEAPSAVDLKPKVSGRLIATLLSDGSDVSEGVYVKKGDTIGQIEQDDYQASLNMAKADLEYARGENSEKDREYKRTLALLKDDTATQQDADMALTALELSRAKLAKAEAELSLAQIKLRETTLISPMDCVVSAKFAYPGAIISENSVVYTLTQMDPLRVALEVPTTYIPLLTPGLTEVKITVDAYPDAPVTAKVAKVYPTADSATRTIRVELSLENPDRRYAPGMFVRAELALDERPNVVVVPFECLLRNDGNYYIYKVANGVARCVQVQTGIRYDDVIEIRSGVSPEDEIVTDGMHRLTDGSRIKVENLK